MTEFSDLWAVIDVYIGAFGDCVHARIAGGADQPVAFRVLQDRPGQAVFAPAAAEYQNVHAQPPLGHGLRAF